MLNTPFCVSIFRYSESVLKFNGGGKILCYGILQNYMLFNILEKHSRFYGNCPILRIVKN